MPPTVRRASRSAVFIGPSGSVVFVRAFVATEPAVGAAHVADGLEVAVDEEPSGRIGVAAISVLEDPLLTGDEGVEVVRRDELVLRPVDELHELRQMPGGRVIDQAEVCAELAEEEQLADAVEDVRVARHVRIGCALAQDPMAKAMEVRDAQAGGGRGAHALVDSLAQLAGRLDVVGQDEELLWEKVFLGLQQPADAPNDHAGLAGTGARDDDNRTVAMLDDDPLRVSERELRVGALGGGRRRYGDSASLLAEMMPEPVNCRTVASVRAVLARSTMRPRAPESTWRCRGFGAAPTWMARLAVQQGGCGGTDEPRPLALERLG